MASIVWTSLCLLFVISLSAVGSAGMIGMPIGAEVQAGLYIVGFLLAGSGWWIRGAAQPALAPGAPTDVGLAIAASRPRLSLRQSVLNPAR